MFDDIEFNDGDKKPFYVPSCRLPEDNIGPFSFPMCYSNVKICCSGQTLLDYIRALKRDLLKHMWFPFLGQCIMFIPGYTGYAWVFFGCHFICTYNCTSLV